MGSVTVIFIVPIMLLFMLIGTVTGAVKGTNDTEVALPYDPSKGYVWEYDNDNDPLFNLIETKIEGNEQIFVFKGISLKERMEISDEVEDGMLMDVIFTDKNGNELLYYAIPDMSYISFYEKINFYAPDEYGKIDYCPKAENEIENGKWLDDNKGLTPYNPIATNIVDGENVFSFLFFPDEVNGPTFEEVFCYVDENREEKERLTVTFRLENGKVEIAREFREFKYGRDWIEVNPETLGGEVVE